jgi:hypothetical protein
MVAQVLNPGEHRIKRSISMCQAFGQRSIRAITKLILLELIKKRHLSFFYTIK